MPDSQTTFWFGRMWYRAGWDGNAQPNCPFELSLARRFGMSTEAGPMHVGDGCAEVLDGL